MAYEVVMPQMGLSMDSGVIIQWLKKDGDEVKRGDLLLEVESDKSVVEVEAVEHGFLHIVRGPQDGSILVGEVIAYLLAQGERQPSPPAASSVPSSEPAIKPSAQPAAAESGPEGSPAAELRLNRPASTPAARRLARELGLDWRLAAPSGPRGEIKVRDVAQLAEATAPRQAPALVVKISPVARHLAESVGLDIDLAAQRYPGARLERQHIEDTLRHLIQRPPESPVAPAPPKTVTNRAQHQPVGRLRRLIAERMDFSARTYAPVTLTIQVDATEMVRLRTRLKSEPKAPVIPSYNALIAWLVARALVAHPHLNATLQGDEILLWEQVNIGVAVDTELGLVVPVFKNVQARSISALSLEMEAVMPRAQQGKATPDELTGGTFTITNLGAFEIEAFTPIINSPESAVLGIGCLKDQAVVLDGEITTRTMVHLSLTFDHRLVDGAPAARFLQQVKHLIERPHLWIL